MSESGKIIRDFIRANQKSDGALDAMEAVGALESEATTVAEEIARVGEFSAAYHAAQQAARSAIKDSSIKLKTGGGYSVAETEQLIQIAREAMADHGLSIAPGGDTLMLEGGGTFLRVRFGIRHVRGYVEWTDHDWPIALSGGQQVIQNARRGTSTTALGYFIRDFLLLERRKDEGEAYGAQQQRRQSGPRRAEPRAKPTISPKAQAAIDRLKDADEAALDAAEGWVADMLAAEEFTVKDAQAVEKAIKDRRDG